VLDIATYSEDTLTVLQARGGLEFEPTVFEVSTHWLSAIAVESATASDPARLHGLYHAQCSAPCDDDCELSCIFEACVACLAHSDCADGQSCVFGECTQR
jgi:hypothetical protein